MRPKHIKTLVLLLFMLCSRFAVASVAVSPKPIAEFGINKFNPAPQPDENEKITALLIQSQVCEVEPQYEPVKTVSYQQIALKNYSTSLNAVCCVNYIDTTTSNHYSRLCRLMLFPRHGFW